MNYYGSNEIGQMQAEQGANLPAKQEIISRTIGQNIAAQIAHHKAEIMRLEGIAAQMREGASMLDLRIEDLRRVMQY